MSYDYNVNPQQPNPYSGQMDPNAGKSDKRVFGMWGLWLGIASIVVGPFLFGLVSIAGIILSIVALVREPRSKALGIWGIVLNAIGFIWMFVFWIFGSIALFSLLIYGTVSTYDPSLSPIPSF